MASYIFAAVGMLLLIPVLYFIPIGFSVTGRLLLAGAALLSAFAAIALQPFLHTLQSVLIGSMLTIMAAFFLPRAASGIFAAEDEDPDIFSFSEPIPAGPYAANASRKQEDQSIENKVIKESYDTEDLSEREIEWFLAPVSVEEEPSDQDEHELPIEGETLNEVPEQIKKESVLSLQSEDLNEEDELQYEDLNEEDEVQNENLNGEEVQNTIETELREEEDEVTAFLNTRNKIMLNDLPEEDDNRIESAETNDDVIDESQFNRSWLEAAASVETAAAADRIAEENTALQEESIPLAPSEEELLEVPFENAPYEKLVEIDVHPQIVENESVPDDIDIAADDIKGIGEGSELNEESAADSAVKVIPVEVLPESIEEEPAESERIPLPAEAPLEDLEEKVSAGEEKEIISEKDPEAESEPAAIDPELFQTILDQFSYMQHSLSASEYEASIRSVIELPLAQEQKLALYRSFLLSLIEQEELNSAARIADEMAAQFSMYPVVMEEINLFQQFITHS
ncbi:hypothetical protein [Jeotgalibacillus campisalis]|uniref:Uncharacterized protein n=1 Tax=Jeotgalibacillus campisalis TaxID=220754 RepID=A0A0C2R7H8_9BACL|nr:hypothetical protein [Jeotgalibacillus campisalis]KIL46215.1 hypothetical protein KR50_28910 [Jeotgalibacillus campisalis]